MRFQERDGDILQAIYENDGLLAKRQIKRFFWPDATPRAMEKRLSKLHHARYIDIPSRTHRRSKPIPEPICWLGWNGALWLAGRRGAFLAEPANEGENQMRILERELRKAGIRWLREPRWNQIEHDLAVIDFRLSIIDAGASVPRFSLEQWITEGHFRVEPDRVSFKVKGRDGRMKDMRRGVIPDGYFTIADEVRRGRGQPHRARFLLELDMATHPHTRFATNKIAAGAAYISSREYRERFGCNQGRWLVVTTSVSRMAGLMKQVNNLPHHQAQLFLFSTQKAVSNHNPLVSPIWLSVGQAEPRSLLQE